MGCCEKTGENVNPQKHVERSSQLEDVYALGLSMTASTLDYVGLCFSINV
jgi:hypothetical protein